MDPNEHKLTVDDIIAMDAFGFVKKAKELGEIVTKKNFAYGDAAANTGKILAILYPDGVLPQDYENMLLIVRILDKLSRIAKDNDPDGENPFGDIAGYGLVGDRLNARRTRNRTKRQKSR